MSLTLTEGPMDQQHSHSTDSLSSRFRTLEGSGVANGSKLFSPRLILSGARLLPDQYHRRTFRRGATMRCTAIFLMILGWAAGAVAQNDPSPSPIFQVGEQLRYSVKW